ncbi:MAG: YkgJ family cysteine cluster protein [Desulfobacterales bacterium]|nr:YkgJ family cysteine cluster protein [Desulfobacterales bacterium]
MKDNLSEFKCLGCQACCKEDGYVRLLENEIDTIAQFMGMEVHTFIETHTRLTRERTGLALVDKENGECIFLTPEGCAINPVKPKQCREFPHGWKFAAFKSICAWAKAHYRIED